jgi:hypothetical protein
MEKSTDARGVGGEMEADRCSAISTSERVACGDVGGTNTNQ